MSLKTYSAGFTQVLVETVAECTLSLVRDKKTMNGCSPESNSGFSTSSLAEATVNWRVAGMVDTINVNTGWIVLPTSEKQRGIFILTPHDLFFHSGSLIAGRRPLESGSYLIEKVDEEKLLLYGQRGHELIDPQNAYRVWFSRFRSENL